MTALRDIDKYKSMEKAEESNGAFASLPVGIKVLCRYRKRILRDVDGYDVRNCGVSGYFS